MLESISENKQEIVQYSRQFHAVDEYEDIYDIYYSNINKIGSIEQETLDHIKPKIQGHVFEENFMKSTKDVNISVEGFGDGDASNMNYLNCVCTNLFVYPLNLKGQGQKLTTKNDVQDTNYIQLLYIIPKNSNKLQSSSSLLWFDIKGFKVKSNVIFQFNCKIFPKNNDLSSDKILGADIYMNNVFMGAAGFKNKNRKYKNHRVKIENTDIISEKILDKKGRVDILIVYSFQQNKYQVSIDSIRVYNEI